MTVSATLRASDRIAFGTLLWIEEDRFLVEVDDDFRPGAEAEIRIELSPNRGTALVRGEIHRRLVTAPSEMSRYLVRITDLADADAERFNAWMERILAGGDSTTSYSVSQRPSPRSTVTAPNHRVGTASRPEPQRPPAHDPRPASGVSSARPDPASSTTGRLGGRDQVREALRRVAALREAAHAPAVRAGDPSCRVGESVTGSVVEVTWHSPGAFQEDLQSILFRSSLSLRDDSSPLPRAGAVRIRLRHESLDVSCDGRVTDTMPSAVTFALAIEGTALTTLLGARRRETRS